ncbi:mismatch repair endonuclease PMS2 isoform X1 [Drosophila pseudoobscura]|uniref:Mismatch repair endonuclease PMS2 isoform X1 n=1 Tax=Drosophila pseudoobscura pseudoobscura TaxID=46245 RepID=A0A6I8VFI8_DROPS|nr:mismatch repair endonuclease PMS2 isoform X1 [Drosophila pseudoobscura]
MAEKEEDVELPAPTTAASGQIKAISKDTVHKICSGQVVLSLAVAVKELVENSIDAGATLVEIKMKDQGLQGVEVSDNGSGVVEANLEAMTAKYHTSKIREFVDLLGVETFGFRGEALSSLCALSDMAIQTRHQSTDVGLKVELDHDGKIKKRSPCARAVGTTVTLTNLFSTLPVRRRDFTRNIKKEFAKMCQILQAYCLVTKGVRIICSNQTPKGAKTVVLQTHGAQDVLANISAIFGARQVADIVPLKSPFEKGQLSEVGLRAELESSADAADTTCTQFSAEDVERLNLADFRLEGYISSCRHGAGRSSRDRQFFFVNARPCDPKNIAKVINETYHRYNVQQQPFIYLNIITARSDVDVNLTPDKRQLLLNNERILLLALKKSLLETFGQTPSTFQMQNTTIVSMLEPRPKPQPEDAGKASEEKDEEEDVPISSSQRFMDVLTQWRRTGDTQGTAPSAPIKRRCAESEELATRSMKMQKIQDFLSQDSPKHQSSKGDSVSEEDVVDQPPKPTKEQANLDESFLNLKELETESKAYDLLTQPAKAARIDCKVLTPIKSRLSIAEPKPEPAGSSQETVSTMDQSDDDDHIELPTRIEFDGGDDGGDDQPPANYKSGELRTTIEEIADSLRKQEQQQKERRTRAKLQRLRFKSEINPNQNNKAEDELQREIAKDDFARMDIIGQFNLGFIIVKLQDDLFIVDQHASDEKYNFETLQRSTQLEYQRLTVPQSLDLTAVNEMVLIDHLPVFEKNGFKFEINHEAPATKKVRLLGKPYSRQWEFGKEDIDELIFMLQDAPEGTICRPSRVRSMFASRACRKSVMIGTALNRTTTMRRLITQMGEIEQPWVRKGTSNIFVDLLRYSPESARYQFTNLGDFSSLRRPPE